MAQFGGLRTGQSHSFTVLKLEPVEFVCKDPNGKPLTQWWYVLIPPDGVKRKKQLDVDGKGREENVPKGECQLTVTQDKPPDDPPPPAPPITCSPPVTSVPDPGEGKAAKDRRTGIDDGLKPLEPGEGEPDQPPPPEPEVGDKEEMPKECGHPLEEDITKLKNREFFDKGPWEGGKFQHACVDRLLKHYCEKDGIDPTAMANVVVVGRGGDASSETSGLPTWLQTWRNTVSTAPSWNDGFHLPRSKLAEAFLWTFLRKKCAENGVSMAPSVDYLLKHLYKSNPDTGNGRLIDTGNQGHQACAGVSSGALVRALAINGYQIKHRYWMGNGGNDPGKMPYFCCWLKKDTFKEIRPLPGDVLDWTASKGPWTGHVVTIACPETQNVVSGKIWVISGNTSPGGTVAVDYVTLVEPYSGYNNWTDTGKRPPSGSVYPWALCRCNIVMPAELDKVSPDQLSAIRVKKVAPTPWP